MEAPPVVDGEVERQAVPTRNGASEVPRDGEKHFGAPAPFPSRGPTGLGLSSDGDDARAPEPALPEPVTSEQVQPPQSEHLPAFQATAPEEPRRRLLPTLRRPTLGLPTRAGFMRALPAVLVVAGGLGLVEGAVTLLWKEPFSALSAANTQQALGADLEALERANAAEAAEAARSRKKTVQYQQRRAVSLRDGLDVGEPVGRLRIDKLDLNKIVVNGADEEVSLKKGLGQQVETPLPGQEGAWTTGIAGHRTTYGAPFRDIDKLDRGDKIVYTLPYGRYIYEVEKTRIVDADYTKAFVPQGADKIVVYACYPMYSDAQRILVYGKLKKSEPRGGAREAAART